MTGRAPWAVYLLVLLGGVGLAPPARPGALFISGDDADDNNHCDESECGQMVGRILSQLYNGCEPLPQGSCILHVGTNSDEARTALLGGSFRRGWNDPSNGGPGACLFECNSLACIANVDFGQYRVLYVASSQDETSGGLTPAQLNGLNARAADIQDWVNNHDGRVMAFTEAGMVGGYGWLPNPLVSVDLQVDGFNRRPSDAFRTIDPVSPADRTIELQFPGNGADDNNLDHFAYHNYFSGPPGYSGMRVLIEVRDAVGLPPLPGCQPNQIHDPNNPGRCIYPPVAVGCCNCRVTRDLPPLCDAGGPYASACDSASVDGASASDPEDQDLAFVWSSDNPAVSVAPAGGTLSASPGVRPVPPAVATLDPAVPPCQQGATLTLTVTDPAGNQTSCEALVSFDDDTPPTVVAPDDLAVPCQAVPAPGTPGVTDACDPNPPVVMTETRADGSCPYNYTLTRDWTATDACGNQASDSQQVVVSDTEAPVLAPIEPDRTVECDAVPGPPTVRATDNCDTPVVIYAEQRVDGNCPGNYQLLRSWSSTDVCGNTAAHTQTLTVRDTSPPTLVGVPADQTVECDAVPPPAPVTALDNCGPAQVTLSERRIDGSCPDNYQLVRTWTATDACGNASQASQTVTVRDTTPPLPLGVLVPRDPLPPGSPGSPASPARPRSPASPASPASVCSAPSARRFEVRCSASDNCDPAPTVEARIDRTWHEVPTRGGPCLLRQDSVPVACGETIELRLVPPPCPAHPPRGPRSAVSAGSDGVRVIVAEAAVLVVTAIDRCGNIGQTRHDPTVPPSGPCDLPLPDGTCCPPIALPAPTPCRPAACPVEPPRLAGGP